MLVRKIVIQKRYKNTNLCSDVAVSIGYLLISLQV